VFFFSIFITSKFLEARCSESCNALILFYWCPIVQAVEKQLDDDNLKIIHPTEFMFTEVKGVIELKYQVVNDRDEPVRGQWLLGLESSNKVHMTTVSYSHTFSTSPVVSVVTGGSYTDRKLQILFMYQTKL